MNTYVRVYPDCLRQAFIKIPAEEVNQAYDAVLPSIQKSFAFPGYRKGKVPSNIIEKNAADDVMQRVVQHLVEKAVAEISSQGVRFYTEPKLTPYSNLSRDQEFVFTMVFESVPEITEKVDVEKLTAPYEELTYDDEMVEYSMKKQISTTEAVKGKIESGDVVTVKILNDGISEDLKEKVFEVKDVPSLEGHKKNDSLELSFKDLGSYVFDFLGKVEGNLNVEITEVERDTLGALDDETVSASTPYKTVEDFRNSIKLQLEQASEQLNKNNRSQALKEAIASKIKVSFPKSFFIDSTDHEMRHFVEESFHVAELSLTGLIEDEKIKNTFSGLLNKSYENVAFILFLDDYASQNSIEPDQDKINHVVSNRARENKMSAQEYRKKMSPQEWSQIQTEARREICIDQLLEKVKFEAKSQKPLIEVK